jgi:hypothetical protein
MKPRKYCRVLDGNQQREIGKTGIIGTCKELMRCFPYKEGEVVFLIDKSLPTAETDIAAYAEAKHHGFDGQEIWRVDFNSGRPLKTERDKTTGSLQAAIVAFSDVPIVDALFERLYDASSQDVNSE